MSVPNAVVAAIEATKESKSDDFNIEDCCACADLSGSVLCCDTCPLVFHVACAGLTTVPEGDFICPVCTGQRDYSYFAARKAKKEAQQTQKTALLENGDLCLVCGDPGRLLCCDSCTASYHLRCINLHSIPKSEFHCGICTGNTTHEELRDLRLRNRRRLTRRSGRGNMRASESESEELAQQQQQPRRPWARHCDLCKKPEIDDMRPYEDMVDLQLIGPFPNPVTGIEYYTHQKCAVWAPHVFLRHGKLVNVASEVMRAQSLRCSVCKLGGAPNGCIVESCKRSFHIICAEQAQCELDLEKFEIRCVDHSREHILHELCDFSSQRIENVERRPYDSSVALFSALHERRENEAKDQDTRAPSRRDKRSLQSPASGLGSRKRRALEQGAKRGALQLYTGVLTRRQRAQLGITAATIFPIQEPRPTQESKVGKKVPSWDDVGGLVEQVNALKDAVILPLLYADAFAALGLSGARGVLLHGPPGTGKTLLARTLAAVCSHETNQEVKFMSLKAGDILSKFYGESEKKLRTVFAEAKEHAPCVIFFDEIDGLAPTRNSKQAQVHSSIVSTMLSLMDGLDVRQNVFVIAATNRVNAIDSALRRPGRFDHEVYVGLPNRAARLQILEINTRGWGDDWAAEKGSLLREMADDTRGYSGADLKALCTETALLALRLPQESGHQFDTLQLAEIVTLEHFKQAMRKISPSGKRGMGSGAIAGIPLSPALMHILQSQLEAARAVLFYNGQRRQSPTTLSILFDGHRDQGQLALASAVLAENELGGVPVVVVDYVSLVGNTTAESPAAACVSLFRKATGLKSCVLVLPRLEQWLVCNNVTLLSILAECLRTICSDVNFAAKSCILATLDGKWETCSSTNQLVAALSWSSVITCYPPSAQQRMHFFKARFEDTGAAAVYDAALKTEGHSITQLFQTRLS